MTEKLMKFSNGTQPSNKFNTKFNPPVQLNENTSVSLAVASIELNNIINLTNDVEIGFNFLDPNDTNYKKLLHKFKVDKGNYTIEELSILFTILMNSKLYYVSNSLFKVEQGGEIMCNIYNNKFYFFFAGRDQSEFCNIDPDKLYYDNSYTYSKDDDMWNLSRTNIDLEDYFNKFAITETYFCRGSGIVSFEDPSIYQLGGVFTGDNSFTTDMTFDDLPSYAIGDVINFKISGSRTITNVSLDPITNALLIDVDGEPIGDIDDTLYSDILCTSYVIGLITNDSIYNDDPDETFYHISYGLAILDDLAGRYYNLPSGTVLLKESKDSDWYSTGIIPQNNPTINIVLGKTLFAPYSINIVDLDNGVLYGTFTDYDYNDYSLILGISTEDGILNDINWTETKFKSINSLTNRIQYGITDEIIDISNKKVNNKIVNNNLGYVNSNSFFTIDFLNSELNRLLGFEVKQNISPNIYNSNNLIVNVASNLNINIQYSFGNSINIKINLPIEGSYLNGEQNRIISYIPFDKSFINDNMFKYSPPRPIFLSLNNKNKMLLDQLEIRIEDDNGKLIDNQISSSIVLIFSDKI